jgi:hypothetical protein
MKRFMFEKRILKLAFAILFCFSSMMAFAQATGSIKGKVLDQVTKQPIIGATVKLDNSTMGAATDVEGIFEIKAVPAGNKSITISYISYQTKNVKDIIVQTNKTYYAEFELIEEVTKMDEVTVRAFRGEVNPLTPVSTFNLGREEIFRNPAASGDIMRALSMLPGVTSSGSQFSAIAARGQGTSDNVFMVDDMPMFNITHLEAEGFNSGFNDPNGGRYSIFAPKVINNVTFQNGGFDATNGRRSSSYLGLNIKEGNKESWSFTGQLELLGATLVADGPISKKTSMFATARYINFGAVSAGLSIGSISLGDYLVKTTTDINKKNKLSFIAMHNPERPYRNIEDVKTGLNINDDNSPGNLLFNHYGSKSLVGLNLRTLVNTSSVLKNVLYFRSSSVDNTFGEFTPRLDAEGIILDAKGGPFTSDLRNINNNQQEFGYRCIYTKRYEKLTLTAGLDAILLNLEYNRTLSKVDTVFTFRSNDLSPNPALKYRIVDPTRFNVAFDDAAFSGAGYVALSWQPTAKFTLNPSVRFDYFGFNEKAHISPRLSGAINFNEKHSISFATGIYFQEMAYSDVAAQSNSNKLENEEAIQNILGYKFQVSPDLKFVAEGWHKSFYNMVVQPNRYQSALNNDGTGNAYGADFTLIKRLSKKFYGQAGYSYMVSKRDDNNGQGEYDYTFSVPHSLNLLGSYKPSDKWLFSAKIRYSTGRPKDVYTVHQNVLNNATNPTYSQEITAINADRYEDYMALDIRADYYKQMKRGVFSAFVDMSNVSQRFNVANEIFVPQTGKPFNIGFGMLPGFGVRFEY